MTFSTIFKQTLLKVQGKKLTVENLASSYDRISTNYTINFNSQYQEYYYDLFKQLGEINNKTILDLGCGTAWLGQLLSSTYSPFLYHGIDISTGMIHEARKNLVEYSKVKIEHGDFQEILKQLPEASYDIVFLTWSLKFNNIDKLLTKILRVLKPGGKLALLTEAADSDLEVNKPLQKLITNNINNVVLALPKTYLPQDCHHLTQYLNEAGFKQTIVWRKSAGYNFSSVNQLAAWARENGLLAAWEQIIDFEDIQLINEFHTLLASPKNLSVKRKLLGALARK
ncbi:MAG: hypothetical protein JM58_18050 [Peptococcaceae bacterium BICA1-8]|nr:MAG: hypothetical protein JM58_18050 [Peptococcaceae bacterium BICA1-8]